MQPARVAGQVARTRNHAVTRHDDRYGIAPVGRADRARRRKRQAEPPRDAAVARRLAIRNLHELIPYIALERAAEHSQRHRERMALAREIFVELLARLMQHA